MRMPTNDLISPKTGQRLKVALTVPNMAWAEWDESSRWRFIPYNICLLAAVVKERCSVRVIDANAEGMSEEQFAAALRDYGPDIVGVTVLMDQYGPSGHRAASCAKSVSRDITVVMGGVYATMNTQQVLEDTNIDYVVGGEGEYVFADLLAALYARAPMPQTGVAFRDAGGVTVDGGHAPLIEDLDSLPLPSYDLVDFLSYVSAEPKRRHVDSPSLYPYARILTSRGCPFGCAFCQVESIHGRKFRARSAENVLDEIQWLRGEYGIRAVIFDDDNLFTDKGRAADIFRGMIKRSLVMPWVSIGTPVFRLDRGMVDLMKESGCEYIDLAIESGTHRVLKEIIGKPVKLDHAVEMASYARNKGIFVAANFIIGFPTETWEEIRETVRFAEEVNVDYVKIFVAIPLRHTRLWNLCVETNSFRKGFTPDGARWNEGQIETDEFTARDLSILRAYEWDRINFATPEKRKRIAQRMHIGESELDEIRRKTRAAAARER